MLHNYCECPACRGILGGDKRMDILVTELIAAHDKTNDDIMGLIGRIEAGMQITGRLANAAKALVETGEDK